MQHPTTAHEALAADPHASDAPLRGATEGEEELFMSISTSRWIALMWATPSLVFCLLVVSTLMKQQADPTTQIAGWITLTTYITLYIATWLLFDTDPDEGAVKPRFYVYQAVLLLAQILLVIFTHRNGGVFTMHMMAFNNAVWMLQAPRRYLGAGFGVMFIISTLENLYFDPFWQFPFGMVAAALSTYFARRSMQEMRLREARQRQLLAVARQSERSRMSADLHDILGHTLTGVTLKAELAKGLLDRGRTQDASAHLNDLLELSRDALAQVRAIVQDNRHMIVDEELAAARDMAQTAGIKLTITGSHRPPAGALSALVARLIREGITNVVTHSNATRMSIDFTPSGIEILNNGYTAKHSAKTRGAGTGLEALAERCRDIGELTWGPQGDSWVLRLTLKEGMS